MDGLSPTHILQHVNRLRAAVQYSNHNFSHQMRRFGAKFKITDAPREFARLNEDADTNFSLAQEYKDAMPDQTKKTYLQARQWVEDVIACSSGRELPGSFNTSVISQLFQELSNRWKILATLHVKRVANICLRFVREAVSRLACPDVYKNMKTFLSEKMQDRTDRAIAELEKLMYDQKKHPITYDPGYTNLVQEMRMRKQSAETQLFMQNGQSAGYEVREDFSASDALICAIAYYKVC